jgi:HSP20 family molecular chaperone IbpA
MSIIVRNTNLPSLFTDFFEDDFFGPHDVLMDKLLSKAFPNTSKELGGPLFESKAYPRVDIRETNTQFVLEAEVPGLTKDQVKVEVKEDALVIKGEKRDDGKKEGKYNVREIKRSSFARLFVLPPDLVDKNSVKAKFVNGILEVSVNKVKPVPPPKPAIKTIDIE